MLLLYLYFTVIQAFVLSLLPLYVYLLYLYYFILIQAFVLSVGKNKIWTGVQTITIGPSWMTPVPVPVDGVITQVNLNHTSYSKSSHYLKLIIQQTLIYIVFENFRHLKITTYK